MRRLTKTQIEHFEQRITQIIEDLIKKEMKQLGPRPKGHKYSDAEKLQLIRAGKAKLKAELDSNPYGYLINHYTYPESAQMRKANMKVKEHDQKYAEIREKYAKQKVTMMDEVILGDSDKAMQVLQQLEQQLKVKK